MWHDPTCMEQAEVDLRNATYSMFVELGRAPTAADVGNRLRLDRTDVVAGWRRLHDAHALVLNQHTDEIRMANPFSAVPTAYRVQCGRQIVVRQLRLGRGRDLRRAPCGRHDREFVSGLR